MNSKPFQAILGVGHSFVFQVLNNTIAPPELIAGVYEAYDASPRFGSNWWIVTGIPDDGISKTLLVGDDDGASTVVWNVYEERFDDDKLDLVTLDEKVSELLALFAVPGGTNPVAIRVTENGSPVTGVELSVWSSNLSVPVVPKILTTTGGIATCALPDGTYKVFCFKPYGSFIGTMPYTLVVSGASILDITMSSARPALPTAPRLTLFGWVLRADLTPVVGAEVKLRILTTPQIVAGGAGLSKFDLLATTDAEGRFELYPIAGVDIMLTCEQVGYSRKGRLPGSGSLNWKDFAVTTI